jgi:toxin ParE1/3/4
LENLDPCGGTTTRAKQDIRDIARYIAMKSGSAYPGRQFARQIKEKCEHLAGLSSKMGRSRDELGEGLRGYSYGNYILILRYDAGTVEIVSVIEGHQDYEKSFAQDEQDSD